MVQVPECIGLRSVVPGRPKLVISGVRFGVAENFGVAAGRRSA